MNVRALNALAARQWGRLGPRFLPFADAASPELPMGRLLRLSLFQVSVGMATVLCVGALNRIMIVELGVSAWLVAVMISLPVLFAPLRALVGFKSDTHRSLLGWRRVPYLWFGTLLQFGGLSIMPFAILLLSGDTTGPMWIGHAGAALGFLMVGAGLHTVQTVGLALATDLAPAEDHPKVVALMCIMLLLGMFGFGLFFGWVLSPFTKVGLVQMVQGTAVITVMLNGVALWKQEARDPSRTRGAPDHSFADTWRRFSAGGHARRRLVALGFGTMAFSMQDVLLEPYGGEVLGLSVGTTTAMTAVMAFGAVIGFCVAAARLARGSDPYRLAGGGALVGLAAFPALIFAAPLAAPGLFAVGVVLTGLGTGMFAHATLTAAMTSADRAHVGVTLGIWGAVQATAAGLALAAGGLIRDGVGLLANHGLLGPTLVHPATGYVAVYVIELALLFATLVAAGPLVRAAAPWAAARPASFPATLQRS